MNRPTSLIAAALCAVPIALAPPGRPDPPDAPSPDAIARFLAQETPPLESAVTYRHLEATTRGGAMRGWVDACASLHGREMRYSVIKEGGSGAVRRRALIAALDGEVKANRGDTSRANLHPDCGKAEHGPSVCL